MKSEEFETKKMCLYQFFGECKCETDYNPNHHPNNFDCPRYYPTKVGIIKIQGKGNKQKRKIFKKTLKRKGKLENAMG